jgi:hypothetical protein
MPLKSPLNLVLVVSLIELFSIENNLLSIKFPWEWPLTKPFLSTIFETDSYTFLKSFALI